MEELHDCGSIEPRSRRDRAAIGEHTWWNRRHSSGAIVARSRPDRGLIVGLFEVEIKADLARN